MYPSPDAARVNPSSEAKEIRDFSNQYSAPKHFASGVQQLAKSLVEKQPRRYNEFYERGAAVLQQISILSRAHTNILNSLPGFNANFHTMATAFEGLHDQISLLRDLVTFAYDTDENGNLLSKMRTFVNGHALFDAIWNDQDGNIEKAEELVELYSETMKGLNTEATRLSASGFRESLIGRDQTARGISRWIETDIISSTQSPGKPTRELFLQYERVVSEAVRDAVQAESVVSSVASHAGYTLLSRDVCGYQTSGRYLTPDVMRTLITAISGSLSPLIASAALDWPAIKGYASSMPQTSGALGLPEPVRYTGFASPITRKQPVAQVELDQVKPPAESEPVLRPAKPVTTEDRDGLSAMPEPASRLARPVAPAARTGAFLSAPPPPRPVMEHTAPDLAAPTAYPSTVGVPPPGIQLPRETVAEAPSLARAEPVVSQGAPIGPTKPSAASLELASLLGSSKPKQAARSTVSSFIADPRPSDSLARTGALPVVGATESMHAGSIAEASYSPSEVHSASMSPAAASQAHTGPDPNAADFFNGRQQDFTKAVVPLGTMDSSGDRSTKDVHAFAVAYADAIGHASALSQMVSPTGALHDFPGFQRAAETAADTLRNLDGRAAELFGVSFSALDVTDNSDDISGVSVALDDEKDAFPDAVDPELKTSVASEIPLAGDVVQEIILNAERIPQLVRGLGIDASTAIRWGVDHFSTVGMPISVVQFIGSRCEEPVLPPVDRAFLEHRIRFVAASSSSGGSAAAAAPGKNHQPALDLLYEAIACVLQVEPLSASAKKTIADILADTNRVNGGSPYTIATTIFTSLNVDINASNPLHVLLAWYIARVVQEMHVVEHSVIKSSAEIVSPFILQSGETFREAITASFLALGNICKTEAVDPNDRRAPLVAFLDKFAPMAGMSWGVDNRTGPMVINNLLLSMWEVPAGEADLITENRASAWTNVVAALVNDSRRLLQREHLLRREKFLDLNDSRFVQAIRAISDIMAHSRAVGFIAVRGQQVSAVTEEAFNQSISTALGALTDNDLTLLGQIDPKSTDKSVYAFAYRWVSAYINNRSNVTSDAMKTNTAAYEVVIIDSLKALHRFLRGVSEFLPHFPSDFKPLPLHNESRVGERAAFYRRAKGYLGLGGPDIEVTEDQKKVSTDDFVVKLDDGKVPGMGYKIGFSVLDQIKGLAAAMLKTGTLADSVEQLLEAREEAKSIRESLSSTGGNDDSRTLVGDLPKKPARTSVAGQKVPAPAMPQPPYKGAGSFEEAAASSTDNASLAGAGTEHVSLRRNQMRAARPTGPLLAKPTAADFAKAATAYDNRSVASLKSAVSQQSRSSSLRGGSLKNVPLPDPAGKVTGSPPKGRASSKSTAASAAAAAASAAAASAAAPAAAASASSAVGGIIGVAYRDGTLYSNLTVYRANSAQEVVTAGLDWQQIRDAGYYTAAFLASAGGAIPGANHTRDADEPGDNINFVVRDRDPQKLGFEIPRALQNSTTAGQQLFMLYQGEVTEDVVPSYGSRVPAGSIMVTYPPKKQ